MATEFVFHIRPLSIEEGFELACEGVLQQPMRLARLYDAVIYALHLGRDLDGELHLFDSQGRLAEKYPLHPALPVSASLQGNKATSGIPAAPLQPS